jgi:hypothetical protein
MTIMPTLLLALPAGLSIPVGAIISSKLEKENFNNDD